MRLKQKPKGTEVSSMAYTVELGAQMPEKKIRAGGLSATIWSNQSKDGQSAYKTISFERTYKNSKGEWQTTNSLRVNDLPKAQLVMQKAFEYCQLGEAA